MCVGKHASLGICVRETRIPRDMCVGNTHPWETHIPVTAAIMRSIQASIYWFANEYIMFYNTAKP